MAETGSDEYRILRAASDFVTGGLGSETTKLFAEFGESTQEFLAGQISLQPGELPFFAHFGGESNWLVESCGIATVRRLKFSTSK